MSPILKYTDKLWDILDQIGGKVSDILIKAESNLHIQNDMNVEEVDKSIHEWCFDVRVGKKWRPIKIGTFLREFFGPQTFTEDEIKDFSEKYNKIKNAASLVFSSKPSYNQNWVVEPSGTKLEIPEWKWDPRNVKNTFISLTCETYPHGHEEEVVPYIKNAGLEKDEFGNYYKIVGKSETMFTCHLDTADKKKSKVTLYSEMKYGQEHLMSDGTTIIGADDKAGVSILLYMIDHNIPGVYYFFIGEERGGIGSGKVASIFEKVTHLKGMKRCVSFDRRNYYSVITQQMGMQCCSDKFGQALADSLGMQYKLDPTGVYTDSANFIELIPECTNISVGYFDEHTRDETQNITFLGKLAQAAVGVNWESLPVARRIGIDDEVLDKYKDFLDDFKECVFNMDIKVVTDYGRTFLRIDMDDPDVRVVQDDLLGMAALLNRNNMDPDIFFEDEFIKIELASYSQSSEKHARKYLEAFDEWQDKPIDPKDDVVGSSGDSDVDELCFWVRKMFSTHKIESKVESEDYNLHSYIFLNKREKIGSLLKIFNVVSKIKNELLTEYSAEVELYENKKGLPILKFDFYWSDGEEDDIDDVKVDDSDGKLPF